jgi:hypothetical protein
VSKTLRHTTSGITADLYGHLTKEAALAAADSLGAVLDAAAAELANVHAARAATATAMIVPAQWLRLGRNRCSGVERLGESNPGPARYEETAPRPLQDCMAR